MIPNRIAVAFVSGLLVVEERRLAEAYALAAQVPQLGNITVSGVGGDGEQNILLNQWIGKLRANGVTSVAVAVRDGAGEAVDGHHRDGRGRRVPADGLPIQVRVDTRRHGPVHVQGPCPGPDCRSPRRCFSS